MEQDIKRIKEIRDELNIIIMKLRPERVLVKVTQRPNNSIGINVYKIL